MKKIISLAKRRGFFYPGSEIYGGLANTWDFGYYGLLLKNNLQHWWWKRFVLDRENIFAVDASVILNPKVWEASGHVTGFSDALIDCKHCHHRTRADHLIEDQINNIKVEGLSLEELDSIIKKNKLKCPHCGSTELTKPRKFNLLFETKLGIIDEKKSKVYLRGELAQGIFMNFKSVLNTMRAKIPFGIASVGVAFRNEITMGQSIFRTLKFDLMEFEYFIHPSCQKEVFVYWKKEMQDWASELGLNKEKLRWREHEEFERSFYSKKTMDLEYNYPFGWKEMWGLAYRTDFDLKNHGKHSGVKLVYNDPLTNKKYIPHVIEPTFGLSRLLITVLINSYKEEEVNGKTRVYLNLDPRLSPIKLAIFPLQKDEKLSRQAKDIFNSLKTEFVCEFDNSGNIGKMYRRQDEIGTPFCLTIDYQTLEDKTVTLRERNTRSQKRIKIDKVKEIVSAQLKI